jgi:hypothetical protein
MQRVESIPPVHSTRDLSFLMNIRISSRTALAVAIIPFSCALPAWADTAPGVTSASVTTRAASSARVDCTAALQRAAARLQLHEETGNSEALSAGRAAVEGARRGTACTVLADDSSPRTPVQAALQRLQLHEQLGNTQALAADRAALAAAQREPARAEAVRTQTGSR